MEHYAEHRHGMPVAQKQVRTGLPAGGGGFEPSVPRKRDNVFRACARSTSPSDAARGTEGSNPAPSTGESGVRTGYIGNGTYLRHG
jgi:hypothetical protein